MLQFFNLGTVLAKVLNLVKAEGAIKSPQLLLVFFFFALF